MKLNTTFTYPYILFLGVALLLAPTTFIRSWAKAKEIKFEKSIQQTVANENSLEVLHGEMLFRFEF